MERGVIHLCRYLFNCHRTPLMMLKLETSSLRLRFGGNCSFATCTSNEDIHEESNTDSVSNVTQHCLDNMIDKWISECDLKSWKNIKHKDKHFQTSPKYSGLNLKLAQLAFEKLLKKDTVFAEVEAAVLHLLPSLDKKPLSVEGLRILLLLNELLHATQRHKRHQTSTKLTEAVAAAVLNLSADSLQVIGDWWSSLSPSTMVRHVNVWKQALSSFECVPRNLGVRNLLLVLQYMYNANSRIAEPQKMPNSDFCLSIEKDFLQEDLRLWRLQSKGENGHAEPLILCSFLTVMDLESKKFVFDLNVNYTKVDWGENFDDDDDDDDIPLYMKDFFYEVFHEMVSADSGMYMFSDSKMLAWFPSKQLKQEDQRYFQFGVLCGLALYNKCIIHLPFPLALFKKLLGVKPSLSDMIEFSPSVGEKEFVDAYVNHAFNASVEGVFQEFKRGFFQMCAWDMVKLFRPKELQEVLVGKDFHDWAKLKQAAVPAIVKAVQKQLDLSVDKMKVNNNILECKYKEDELEQYSRKENIRINGMEEQSGEESEDQLVEKVCSLAAAPGSDMKEEDISMAHRLGGVKKQGRMRPVIVRFVSRKKADLIKLKENDTYKKVFICEDLTNMRYKLFRYAKGKCDLTFVRDGKIICKKDGKYITSDNLDDLFLIGYVNVDYKELTNLEYKKATVMTC
ncbi:hypothetical protein ABVT39_024495 [Epinephelus coioides]